MIVTTCVSIAYTISIVGAQGRLGRELVAQSLQRGWNVEAVVRRPLDPVLHPVRTGWLSQDGDSDAAVPLSSENLTLTDETSAPDGVDAIVFCMSAEPFATREALRVQTEVVRRMLWTCANDDARVCLVSAYGAGDSLNGSNVGIQFMHAVYLREAYAAKEEQEALVTRRNLTSLILRPRVLSFTQIPFNGICVPRFDLSRRILDWCAA